MNGISKFIGSAASTVALVLIAGQVSAQNLVLNPGFETAGTASFNAANWINQFAGTGVAAYGIRTNDNPNSGSFNYELHLASDGAGPLEELVQTGIVASASTAYNFSFFADRLPGSVGDADQYVIFWLNSGGLPIGNSGFFNFTPGNNVYAQTSRTVTSIAGTVFAEIDFHIAGSAVTNQTATLDFDTVSFAAAVPEPSTVALVGLGLAGAVLGFRKRRS